MDEIIGFRSFISWTFWTKRFLKIFRFIQGCNARKVISEVYASCVLQCNVSWRLCKHKTDVEAWHRIDLSNKKSMKYSGHRKLSCENLMLLTSSDILNEHWCIYSCLRILPRESRFQNVRKYTQLQLTFLVLQTSVLYIKKHLTHKVQGYPQRIRLQVLLYGIN